MVPICMYIYIYIGNTYIQLYIYIYIYTHVTSQRKGGRYGWKPSSSSSFSTRASRAFRAYPLVEIRQAVPRRAIRGNSISVNSTLPPLIGGFIGDDVFLVARRVFNISFATSVFLSRGLGAFVIPLRSILMISIRETTKTTKTTWVSNPISRYIELCVRP